MIESQLRQLNDALVQKGMIIGPAFSTIADLVLQYGHIFTRQPLPGVGGPGTWACAMQTLFGRRRRAGRFMWKGTPFRKA